MGDGEWRMRVRDGGVENESEGWEGRMRARVGEWRMRDGGVENEGWGSGELEQGMGIGEGEQGMVNGE